MTTKLKPLPKPPSTQELEKRLSAGQAWATKAALPWADANPRIKVGFTLRLDEVLHAQLKFLQANEPKASIHSILLEAAQKEVELRLKKHFGDSHEG